MSEHLRVARECGALVAAGLLDFTVAVGQVYAAAQGAVTLAQAAHAVRNWQNLEVSR